MDLNITIELLLLLYGFAYIQMLTFTYFPLIPQYGHLWMSGDVNVELEHMLKGVIMPWSYHRCTGFAAFFGPHWRRRAKANKICSFAKLNAIKNELLPSDFQYASQQQP